MTGSVVDAGGDPVAGAELRLRTVPPAQTTRASVRSAADGTFRCDGIWPHRGVEMEAEARKRGYRRSVVTVVLGVPVRVVLEKEP